MRVGAASTSDKVHFTRWEISSDTSLSAIMPDGMSHCGVYVLTFDDNEEYVGQSVDILARFATHRRHQTGTIVFLDFTPVPPDKLDIVERDTIARKRAAGISLRNIDLVDLPLRSEALDVIIDPAGQQEWLAGNVNNVILGSRPAEARTRRRQGGTCKTGYTKLAERPDYPDLVNAFACYIATCIPLPQQTEKSFWSVTAYPSTGRSSTWRRLAALSINNVEVLVLGERCTNSDGTWITCGFMNLARDTVVPHRWVRYTDVANYASTGNLISLHLTYPGKVAKALREPTIIKRARRLAMGLLRKGKSMMARYHDIHFADDIFIQMETDH